ncbi:MAG: glycine zipper 2TM domain-containing protein [Proteobacteria bacterium]|nr:glycine zipper 2TM domain-containing protein [Pseudomonadota bacterium]MBU4275813.1 glycine zipper 2TM domain-containing protein [Pseudomonadota bacterium]MBU4383848.1 glycine zipper 2TM domain-containing protein [Pseudomonadota bacterium]MBU4606586.1 glycine zipper 2TM domain-containing protein [Pseudomonadota bacterium]MCG2763490.1 YMGG-like glycine zipper-containing protein [Desulfarculaceae bacterium]
MFRKVASLSLCLLLGISLLAVGCASVTKSDYEGAGVGAATGAVAGALLDSNGWRGGVIGGALGALAGGAITHIATHASTQAAQTNQPVVYQKNDGTEKITSTPMGATKNNCHMVKERYYKNGEMYKEVEREVCN